MSFLTVFSYLWVYLWLHFTYVLVQKTILLRNLLLCVHSLQVFCWGRSTSSSSLFYLLFYLLINHLFYSHFSQLLFTLRSSTKRSLILIRTHIFLLINHMKFLLLFFHLTGFWRYKTSRTPLKPNIWIHIIWRYMILCKSCCRNKTTCTIHSLFTCGKIFHIFLYVIYCKTVFLYESFMLWVS